MTTLIDFIMDLFRSPQAAASFVANPDQTMRDAGVPANVTAAQIQAVAATAAPAGLALGGGDPVVGLQRAVADHHNIASPFSPTNTFAPQTDFASHNNTPIASGNEFASHNNTPIASGNDIASPHQDAGANAQNGAFNLGFGDITLGGDHTQNTATEGGVVNTGTQGDVSTTSTHGDGNVVGDDNNANTGTVLTGDHGSTTIGKGNETDIKDSSQHAGGDVISGNDGPVIKDNDMSGGGGGSASSHGGGGLINAGTGGNEANAGGGGGGGSIVLTDSHNNTNSGNSSVGGDQTTTNVGHDVNGSIDASHDDNSQGQDNSRHDHQDNSTGHNVDSHDDNSQHNPSVDTHISNDVGLF